MGNRSILKKKNAGFSLCMLYSERTDDRVLECIGRSILCGSSIVLCILLAHFLALELTCLGS